ncbi:hypothetical protein MNBD_UNCLBAC01-290 [hydrothermal vent metagenome]|uniref:Lipoprotein n=1 Tax=hydrothermal vent metagenome TaxID=652676 RepID=A0A3B1E4T7_9ZZZZ
MKLIIVCLSLLSLSACSNYLYKGNIRALDSNGVDREVMLYWNKTAPLLGADKAGPAVLLTECGSLISFDERDQGVIFRGESGRDMNANTGLQVEDGDICGKFLNKSQFVEINEGELELSILCAPVDADDFSISKRSYIGAKDSPYKFNIIASKKWSFLGGEHQAPSQPECNDE